MTFSPRLIYFYNWKKFESSNFEEFSKNRRIHGKRNELRSSSFSLINTTLERAAFDRVQSFVDHTFQRTPCKEWSYNMVVWTTHVEGRNSLSATRRRDTIEMGGGGHRCATRVTFLRDCEICISAKVDEVCARREIEYLFTMMTIVYGQ